jgi:hypothetical protein
VERSHRFEQRLVRELRITVRAATSVDGETFEGAVDLVVEKWPKPLLVSVPTPGRMDVTLPCSTAV